MHIYLHMSICIRLYIWSLVYAHVASISIAWDFHFWDLFTSGLGNPESKLREIGSLKRHAPMHGWITLFWRMLMLFYIFRFYYEFACFFSGWSHYFSDDMWLMLVGLNMDDSLFCPNQLLREGISSYLFYPFAPLLVIIIAWVGWQMIQSLLVSFHAISVQAQASDRKT